VHARQVTLEHDADLEMIAAMTVGFVGADLANIVNEAALLGGRAAEELIYEEASTGAHDDLTKATDIARSMIKTFGMSPKLGQISFERDRRTMLVQAPEPVSRHDYSEETAREIDIEVRRIIDEQIERVGQLLEERKPVLLRAARTLIAKETITGAELRAIALEAGDDEADGEEATDGHSVAADAWLGP
jgi:cell division protease FtsH